VQADIVADVGNSRIKWGRCASGRIVEMTSLPPDDVPAWQRQLDKWGEESRSWVIAGVHPARCLELAEWLRSRGRQVDMLERAAQLPLQARLEHPDRVGIDRLLNAVAANARRSQGKPAAIIGAGSAVTVDYVDSAGAFQGGAILPGLRLMARALNDHTALLPLVEVQEAASLPGSSTTKAIQAGVFWAVVAGVEKIVRQYRTQFGELDAFLTGGDAAALLTGLQRPVALWPEMTLEGLRLAALVLPGAQSP